MIFGVRIFGAKKNRQMNENEKGFPRETIPWLRFVQNRKKAGLTNGGQMCGKKFDDRARNRAHRHKEGTKGWK